jgi:hypothetical protein
MQKSNKKDSAEAIEQRVLNGLSGVNDTAKAFLKTFTSSSFSEREY